LGIQLDSLADLVTFGVFPGCILFLLLQEVAPAPTVAWLPYSSFLFTAGVALRLAKFNTDTRDRTVFHGLPTPSAATFVFGLLWMSLDYHVWWRALNNPVLLCLLVLILPLLMLSNLRLWSIKGLHHQHGKLILVTFAALFVLFLLVAGSAAVSLQVVIYILFGIANLSLKLY
jgi:CDP-diacylglycerol--serine O-phosphatidyltransferase